MGIFDNYKEQNAELKRLKKERKLLKRKQMSNEAYKIRILTYAAFLILMLIAFTIGPIFSLLDNLDNTNFDMYDNLTQDYIDKLDEEVNVDNLIKHGRLSTTAHESLYNTLKTYGIDIFNADHSINVDKANTFTKPIVNPISLDGDQIGAFVNGLLNGTNGEIEIEGTDLYVYSIEVIELSIYKVEEDTHVYSVLSIPLSDLLDKEDLPDIYLSTDSIITVENNKLTATNSTTKINELDDETNKNIIGVLNAILLSTDMSMQSINTDIIWTIMQNLATNLHAEITLNGTTFTFVPKQY